MSSALEQFEINIVYLLYNKYIVTNTAFAFSIVIFIFLFVFLFSHPKLRVIPTKVQWLFNKIYFFIHNLVFQFLKYDGNTFFLFITTLFLFILFTNLLGMVPYSFTPTSHIIITFYISLSVFVGVTLIGVQKHRFNFLNLFFPAGSPLALAPLLVGIELISYISRAFSLAIRLFANLMSGHTLLHLIGSFCYDMLCSKSWLSFVAILPIILLVLLNGLELAIAMLQAYVFTILTCIYLKDSFYLH